MHLYSSFVNPVCFDPLRPARLSSGFLLFLLVLVISGANDSARSQQNMAHTGLTADSVASLVNGNGAEAGAIVRHVIENEIAFREALKQYTFATDVLLETVGRNGEVTGRYIRKSQFVIDDRGGRVEKVKYHPKSTIREMKITKEDILDLAGVQPFGFDISDLDKYEFELSGDTEIDGRRAYAINVQPRKAPDPHKMGLRFFVGEVWVDAASYRIIKMRGIAQPQGKQRFPIFETRRVPVSNTFWVPSETAADDILRFPEKDVHYRMTVRYSDFKKFSSTVKVVEIDGR